MSLLSLAIAALLAADHQLLARATTPAACKFTAEPAPPRPHPPKYVAVQPTPVVLVFHGALMKRLPHGPLLGAERKV